MDFHSEDSELDYDRIHARVSHDARETSPSPPPRGRLNSDVIAGVGGHFAEGGNGAYAYPPQLDISEAVNTDRPYYSPGQNGHSNHGVVMGRSGSPAVTPLGGSPSTSRTPTPRAHLLAFLQPDVLHRPPFSGPSSQTHSRRTHSAGQRATSSHSSTKASAHTAATVSTTHNGDNITNTVTAAPYFSPSHTPSNRSAGTSEEDYPEGRAPDSPYPFSDWDLYNTQHGRSVVEELEQRLRRP